MHGCLHHHLYIIVQLFRRDSVLKYKWVLQFRLFARNSKLLKTTGREIRDLNKLTHTKVHMPFVGRRETFRNNTHCQRKVMPDKLDGVARAATS